jgi:hypothetical protein
VRCPLARSLELYPLRLLPIDTREDQVFKLHPCSGLLAQCMFRSSICSKQPSLMINRIQCASVDIGMLVVGRVVAGLCVGIASSICPVCKYIPH